MDPIKRIDELMRERGWTDYKLTMEAGLASSTVANIHRRNTVPSITTLEAICNAFGITLSQFFADDTTENVPLSPEQRELFQKWVSLTDRQKDIISAIIQEFQ